MVSALDIIDISGTLLLSGLLALLYYKQYRLDRVRFRPSIEISDTEAVGDELHVWISNFGEGIAKDLRVETFVAYSDSEEYNRDTLLYRHDDSNESTRERAIGSNEKGVKFVGTPRFITPEVSGMPGGRSWGDFSSGMRHLATNEYVDDLDFTLEITYQDQLDNKYSRVIIPSFSTLEINEENEDEMVENQFDLEVALGTGSIIESRRRKEGQR